MLIKTRESYNEIEYGYYKDDLFTKHREDGPAWVHLCGDMEWWFHGQLHRENGPAIECKDGYRVWYFHGKRHRENGPAIEYGSGECWWYLEGELIEKENFDEALKIYRIGRMCK
jgi:hypothetical protein